MPNNLHLDAKILIVDDQDANLILLKSILKLAGYKNIVTINAPREMLHSFNMLQPDLILLDLMMPEMDGYQVMKHLEKLVPEGDYLPILVLTADITRESRQRALGIGATDFLTKPFDHTEVLLRINNLLQTRFLHMELKQQNSILAEQVHERTKKLANMLQQVMTAQETERKRLSMEIHDGPLQSLGVCKMAVDRAVRRYSSGQHERVLSELQELRSILVGTIDEVRGVLADLSPEILTRKGLSSALRDYVDRFTAMTSISVHVNMDDSISTTLPAQLQLLLYRLGQEALSNVRKHARANKVELSLKREGDTLFLVIADDGIGFDIAAVSSEHIAGKQLGLRYMRERIQSAGGELLIDSAEAKGTNLQFQCPLRFDASYTPKKDGISASEETELYVSYHTD